MSTEPGSILDGRETLGPWNYSSRVPDGASSRDYAFLPLVIALLFGGIGIFLASDIVSNVPFWSNAAVWCVFAQSAVGVLISVWMFFGRWAWTAPQMALFGIVGLAPVLWAFQGAPLLAFVLYSKAPWELRITVLLFFVAWHGWWIQQTTKRCLSIWSDDSMRDKVWIPYDCATVYRQFAAKSAMEAKGVAWHPGPGGLLLPVVLCIPMYIYRHEIVAYLGVPWIPLAILVLGFTVFTLVTTVLTFGCIAMLVLPARIVAATGNPVLVDMMTPADAPK